MKRKRSHSTPVPKTATPKKRSTGQRANREDAPEVSAENGPVKGQQEKAQAMCAEESTLKSARRKRVVRDDTGANNSGIPALVPTETTASSTGAEFSTTPMSLEKIAQSALSKSIMSILDHGQDEYWDGEDEPTPEIFEDSINEPDQGAGASLEEEEVNNAPQNAEDNGLLPVETPSKRGRGRPKGAKNKRSPTPEGDIPPEERYFFQNRAGPPQISGNTMASVKLFTHEEYFEQIRIHEEDHMLEKAYLARLHARSFPQWLFELGQGFNICLYGWGSKRLLTTKFARWMHSKCRPKPAIVIVNGYIPKLSIRTVLATLASAVMGNDMPARLAGQPHEMVDTILSSLSNSPPSTSILVVINSIDSQALREKSIARILARIASHPSIQLVATADTPTVALLWDSSLLDQLGFLFHDCTTYAPYHAELNVVDDVNELLGRKGKRMGGKEGVGFVLKSLPENARNLYRLILTEILSVLSDDHNGNGGNDLDRGDGVSPKGVKDADDIGIEYRSVYEKASEEFICSSDMNFRFLLKEFHDHQMVTSSRDASGTEVLGVPLTRDDMQGVLDDLKHA